MELWGRQAPGVFTTPPGGSNPALKNLTLAGTFNVPSGASTTLEGTITNNGTIEAPGELIVSGAVTLKGSGTTVMQGGTLQSTLTDKLTNLQLIHGYGTLLRRAADQTWGTIAADSSAKTLTLPSRRNNHEHGDDGSQRRRES